MRITTAGAGTIFSSPIPNGRLEVPGAYLQTGSDTAVQLNAAADWAAQKICPRTDWQLNALAWYVTAVATEGNAAIKLFSDDGAADSSPDSAIATLSNSFGSGDAADVWKRDYGFTPCQLQRGKTYWLVFQGTDGADFSLSCRRWNTNVGSMFPDEMPAAKISTDGGSSWSALTQDSKPAILNIVLNASANIVPPLIYGRYNGQFVYLPGVGVREIPEAGVSLACDALTADTLYYVYIYYDSGLGTLRLVAVTTVPTLDEGILVRPGLTNQRYVGMIYPQELQTGYQGPVDCMDSRLVMNHYHKTPRRIGKLAPYSNGTTDSGVAGTWEKFRNSDDYKFQVLGDGSSMISLEATAAVGYSPNIAPYVAIGVDEVTPHPECRVSQTATQGMSGAGLQIDAISTLRATLSLGAHSVWPLQKSYNAGASYFVFFKEGNAHGQIDGFTWC